MAQSKPQPRVFYGWYIVGVCFVMTGIMGASGATFPVFLVALTDEFHWSQGGLGGTVSIGMVVGGFMTPFWGAWTDRSGPRVVVVVAVLFGALTTFLRAYIDTLPQLYVLSAVGAIFFSGASLIPLSSVISRWFHEKRGKAMGIMLVGGGIGGFAGPQIANYFIETFNWRIAYMWIAAILWIGIIPLAALILRRSPEDMGLLPDGKTADAPTDSPPDSDAPTETVGVRSVSPSKATQYAYSRSLTPKEAAGTLAFWMIAIAFLLPMMTGVGLITHLMAIFKDAGVDSRTASFCLGLIGGLSIISRLAFGLAADRFDVRKVFTIVYACEATAVAILLTTPFLGTKALFGFVLVYGLTGGGGLVLAPIIISKCFGLKSMGAIFGMLAIAAVIGGAIGAWLVGFIIDVTGGYYLAFAIFTGGEICAAIAISRAHSPLAES